MTDLAHDVHRASIFGMLLISFGVGLSIGVIPSDYPSVTFLAAVIVLMGLAFVGIGAVDDER